MRKKTLIVVGAGASAEYGMPVGPELRTRVRNLLSGINDGTLLDPPNAYYRAVAQIGGSVRGLTDAATKARDAINFRPSIDQFLSDFRDDEILVKLCRLAIANEILACEHRSTLRMLSDKDPENRNAAFLHMAETWLGVFFQRQIAGLSPDHAGGALKDCSFLVFNYDRCLELYLQNALTYAFGITREAARAIVDEVPLVHVYGSLGTLPGGMRHHTDLEFGNIEHAALDEVAQRIQTFSEQPPEDLVDRIKALVGDAEQVLFIGYSYHQQGLDLIFPDGQPLAGGRSVRGTAFGAHPAIVTRIQNTYQIHTSARRGADFLRDLQFELW